MRVVADREYQRMGWVRRGFASTSARVDVGGIGEAAKNGKGIVCTSTVNWYEKRLLPFNQKLKV